MIVSGSSHWVSEELVGGDPSLDLLNTAGGASKARDVERLTDYATALSWAREVGLIEEGEARRIAGDGAEQVPAFDRLRRFREALHGTFLALSEQRSPPEASWGEVGQVLAEARAAATLRGDGTGYRWWISPAAGGAETIRLRAALAAEALLTGADLALVRACERCSWLYLDRSRGRRRRWCRMAACGNRAKAQRHYARTKGDAG